MDELRELFEEHLPEETDIGDAEGIRLARASSNQTHIAEEEQHLKTLLCQSLAEAINQTSKILLLDLGGLPERLPNVLRLAIEEDNKHSFLWLRLDPNPHGRRLAEKEAQKLQQERRFQKLQFHAFAVDPSDCELSSQFWQQVRRYADQLISFLPSGRFQSFGRDSSDLVQRDLVDFFFQHMDQNLLTLLTLESLPESLLRLKRLSTLGTSFESFHLYPIHRFGEDGFLFGNNLSFPLTKLTTSGKPPASTQKKLDQVVADNLAYLVLSIGTAKAPLVPLLRFFSDHYLADLMFSGFLRHELSCVSKNRVVSLRFAH